MSLFKIQNFDSGAHPVKRSLQSLNMEKTNTFIIPIIHATFLARCLETLYQYTPPNFYVFVVDQTADGVDQSKFKGVHLWLRPHRNMGFAKAINMGFNLSQTPYVTCLNDDVEFINDTWWQGILDTFKMDPKIVAVNPNSPKEGAWGYGLKDDNKDTWVPKEGFVRDEDGRSVVPLIDGIAVNTPELAKEHYDGLLNRNPIWQKDTLCDGLACWCTVFKREGLAEMGIFDEKFYPGGGEDYDMMARIYSCAWPESREVCDASKHRRAVGTTKSWVWHWWGKSKDDTHPKDPIFSRPRWNALEELWGDDFDVWGHENMSDGTRKPLKRLIPLHIEPL